MKNWFQRVYDWLAGFGKYVKDLIIDIFTDAVKDFMKRMGPEIEEILKEIQADPSLVLDEDKRNAAFNKIKEAAKEHGVATVKDSVIYMAIEMIIQALKNREELGPNEGETTETKSCCKKKKTTAKKKK